MAVLAGYKIVDTAFAQPIKITGTDISLINMSCKCIERTGEVKLQTGKIPHRADYNRLPSKASSAADLCRPCCPITTGKGAT